MYKLISNQTRTMYGTYLELMYLSRVYGLKGRQFKIVHVTEKGQIMGYRSEVKSLIYGTKEQMAKFNNENVVLLTALSEDFGKDLTHTKNDEYEIIFLDVSYSKWYDSYSEVIRWNNLLTLANEAELMTEFVRIGEETGDIEQEYSQTDCEYYLETVSTINANF